MDLRRLDWILVKAQDIDLSTWEEKFIADMTERRERYGDKITISDKQEEILERIAEKD
jgi:hypothetical protein